MRRRYLTTLVVLGFLSLMLVPSSPAAAHHLGGSHWAMNLPNWNGTGRKLSVVYLSDRTGDSRVTGAVQYAADYLNQFFWQGRSNLYVALSPGGIGCGFQGIVIPVCMDATVSSSYAAVAGFSQYPPNPAWLQGAYIHVRPATSALDDYWAIRNTILQELGHGVIFNGPYNGNYADPRSGHSADPGSVMCGGAPYISCYSFYGVQRHMNTISDQAALFAVYPSPQGENGTQ